MSDLDNLLNPRSPLLGSPTGFPDALGRPTYEVGSLCSEGGAYKCPNCGLIHFLLPGDIFPVCSTPEPACSNPLGGWVKEDQI